jgi:pilus assembly protein Flp/PilA
MKMLLPFLKAKTQRGATMVEYAVLVALITVAVVFLIFTLGGQINEAFQAVVDCLETPSACSPT